MELVKISLIGNFGIFVVRLLAIHPPTRVSTNAKGKFYLFWTSGIAVWVAFCVCAQHKTKRLLFQFASTQSRPLHFW